MMIGEKITRRIARTIFSQNRGKEMANAKNFKSLDALQSVVNVVNEAGEAVKDKSRTIRPFGRLSESRFASGRLWFHVQ